MIEYTVLQGLAVFGLSWLIRHTDGPFDVFYKVRKLFGIQYIEVYEGGGQLVNIVEEIPEKFFAKLVGCFWCLATWFSLLVTIYGWYKQYIVQGFEPLIWLAAIGVAGLFYEVLDYER